MPTTHSENAFVCIYSMFMCCWENKVGGLVLINWLWKENETAASCYNVICIMTCIQHRVKLDRSRSKTYTLNHYNVWVTVKAYSTLFLSRLYNAEANHPQWDLFSDCVESVRARHTIILSGCFNLWCSILHIADCHVFGPSLNTFCSIFVYH